VGLLKVNAVGNVGKQPELRYSQAGKPFLSFSVAAGIWNGKEEVTEWLNCTLFGPRAVSLSERITKGQQLYISGKLATRQWQGQDGATRTSLDVTIDDIELMRAPKGESAGRSVAEEAAEMFEGDLESIPF